MNKALYAILSFLAFGILSQLVYASSVTPAWSLGAWTNSTTYPTQISFQSCSISNSYIYCMGGFNGTSSTNATYFAKITKSGIGNWTATTPYPYYVQNAACVTYLSYIYCVGGTSVENPVNQTFFAKISASGIGNWTQTSTYPSAVSYQSCNTYDGNIYCVGGGNGFGGSNDSTFFAGLGPSGIGAWRATAPYPINISSESCVVNDTYLYCVGGISGQNSTASAYYTTLNSAGNSEWTPTTPYPAALSGESCAASNGNIYCTGGYSLNSTNNYTQNYTKATFYAPLKSTGIGQWAQTTNYPFPSSGESCNSYNNFIYCIGGAYLSYSTGISIFAPLTNPNNPTSTTTMPVTTITKVSTGNTTNQSGAGTTTTPTSQGSNAIYLIVLFLVVLILLMVAALYLFNRKPASQK